MSTESGNFYRYANEAFIRANSSEHMRFGVDANTSWAKKTIDGYDGYWTRIRVGFGGITTTPVFEQFKLHSSRSEANEDGTMTYHGLARFGSSIQSPGANLLEIGTNAATSFTVGTGADPLSWTHVDADSRINTLAEGVALQFTLPRGIDTSFPLEIDFVYKVSSAGTGEFVISVLPIEVAGVLEADPTGGIVPVPRSIANTDAVTANSAQTQVVSLDTSSTTKIIRQNFTGFDISDYYEGDIVFVRLVATSNIGGAVIDVLGMEVKGVSWTLGEKI